MKKTLALTALLTFNFAFSQLNSKDIFLHSTAGATIGTAGAVANDGFKIGLPDWIAFVAPATIAGLGKELYDGKFSTSDFTATVLGGVTAYGIDVLMKAIGVNTKYTRVAVIAGGVIGIGVTVNGL